MIPATLSILGLYKYDDSIFDNLVTPFEDNENLIQNILMECAELEILYPDADFMKFAIGAWSQKQLPIWNKLYNTEKLEYNPLENANRTEETNDTTLINESNSGNNKATLDGNSTNTRQVFPFDGNISQPQYIDDIVPHQESDNNYTDNREGQNTFTSTKTIKGSIGVVTPQEMINQERNVAKFSTVNYIIEQFKQRFCIVVY